MHEEVQSESINTCSARQTPGKLESVTARMLMYKRRVRGPESDDFGGMLQKAADGVAPDPAIDP